MNTKIALGCAIVICGSVIAASIIRHRSSSTPDALATNQTTPDAVAAPEIIPEPMVQPPPAKVQKLPPPALTQPPPTVPVVREMPKQVAKTVIAPIQLAPPAKVLPLHPAVPVGRAALSFVGMDPGAELIWGLTINDPSVPPDDRKNLIEDLNEDGFPDPKHVTVDDVPLIMNRMALIEQLAPDSMDETNAAAFLEAYKDLANMLAKAAN